MFALRSRDIERNDCVWPPTLTDQREYSCDEICELYHQRWQVELDIRSIKITMGLDVLRCKTPTMVRKEMLVGVLMVNLIRQTMLQTAEQNNLSPRCISFTASLQTTAPFWQAVAFCDEQQTIDKNDQRVHAKSFPTDRRQSTGTRGAPCEKTKTKKGKLLMISRTAARQNLLYSSSQK